ITIDFDNLNVLVVADSLPLKKLLVSVLKDKRHEEHSCGGKWTGRFFAVLQPFSQCCAGGLGYGVDECYGINTENPARLSVSQSQDACCFDRERHRRKDSHN